MAFAVLCKSCNARFLLSDELLQRKLAGRVVTVRCRQCHASIHVDSSQTELEATLPEGARTAGARPAGARPAGARPAPAPPRPVTQSTLMGIGALPRAASSNELVALSRGLLSVRDEPAPAGFPVPPPPPPPLQPTPPARPIELFDAGDWDNEGSPPSSKPDAAPESIDDFIEELPPSIAPAEEEIPSSSGTPSLKALTHLVVGKPKVSDFLDNVGAATNGGILGAPTIDISDLGLPTAFSDAPSIDVSQLASPARGHKTLPLFELSAAPDLAPSPSSRANHSSGSRAWKEPRPAQRARSEGLRERRNVVPPTTLSEPTQERRRSSMALPLVLVLAAAAGFLIWKRSAAPRPEPAAVSDNLPTRPDPGLLPTPSNGAVDLAADTATGAEASPGFNAVATATQTPNAAGIGTVPPPGKAATGSGTPARSLDEPASDATRAPDQAKPPEPEVNAEPISKPEEPTAEPADPFDKAAAAAALGDAVGQASACRKDGDATGVASVIVTFAPSGRVTSANVSGPPFAGTPTGGCIAATLRRTKVPPFSGDRVTVSKTVVIQ